MKTYEKFTSLTWQNIINDHSKGIYRTCPHCESYCPNVCSECARYRDFIREAEPTERNRNSRSYGKAVDVLDHLLKYHLNRLAATDGCYTLEDYEKD